LVQVCRYLSERLVEAWETEEGSCGIAILAVPNSTQGTGQRPILQTRRGQARDPSYGFCRMALSPPPNQGRPFCPMTLMSA
jgi:hypothetical protein